MTTIAAAIASRCLAASWAEIFVVIRRNRINGLYGFRRRAVDQRRRLRVRHDERAHAPLALDDAHDDRLVLLRVRRHELARDGVVSGGGRLSTHVRLAVEYVRGHIHTNNIEGFWSILKRTIKGTYIAPRSRHLQRYIEEQVFRFNERENADGLRFVKAVAGADGKRVTYKALIAK